MHLVGCLKQTWVSYNRFIRPEDLPVQYGGLSRSSDLQSGPPKPASEFTVKGGEKVNIQIEGIEVITCFIVLGCFHFDCPVDPPTNIFSNLVWISGWCDHNMGHSGGRVGLGIRRRVRAERRRQLHHRRGQAEEDGLIGRSRAQLLHVARGRQTRALRRQQRLSEKESGCLPIRRPQIHHSLASKIIIKSKRVLILCSFFNSGSF